jgi:hypothetical protein
MTTQPDRLSLGGEWEFLPSDCTHDALPDVLPGRLTVPGLWEAQGYLQLDGPAWYRTRFELPGEVPPWWTLRFCAVMDETTVWLNGHQLGSHMGGFTPFEVDASTAVLPGTNVLEVRVVDHASDSAEHRRTAHGKQGWMNHVFPSPPSLYMTYGGIWQDVQLFTHPQVRLVDMRVIPDPDDVQVEVELRNVGPDDGEATVTIELLGQRLSARELVAGGATAGIKFHLGATDAPRWTPAAPALHTLQATASMGTSRQQQSLRFGLRTFRVSGHRFLLNDEPFPLRSALVQGFYPDTLYAETNREAIEAEVRAAQTAGLTMLRLHIKAFDPLYLDVCDELGMLVHADIPVAEPIAHDELDGQGDIAERSAAALVAQVRRDRNHPSLVLWSVMNELGAEKLATRKGPGYQAFVRRLYGEAVAADGTRPIIENDWIEPDPDEVFCSPVLTAHWYGRLSADYLNALDAKVSAFSALGRPLFVSEFGDWGLPALDREDTAPFWWAGGRLRSRIESLPWAGTAEEFVAGTQRYQGISDRLQIEIFRKHNISGWCVTELTDVPQEYNGLWDLDRRPKVAALEQIERACQPVLPIVQRHSWSAWADEKVTLPLYVDNGSDWSGSAQLTVAADGILMHSQALELSAYEAHSLGDLSVELTGVVGAVDLHVTVNDPQNRRAWSNSYQLTCLERPSLDLRLDLSHAGDIVAVVRELGGSHANNGPLLVAEHGLADAWQAVRDALHTGRNVLVLAQDADAACLLPFTGASAVDIRTEWGSTPFVFSTGEAGLSALAGAKVLASEALTVMPIAVWTDIDGKPWADRTLVGLYKPYPGEIVGTVVGCHALGSSNVWLCQLPLAGSAEDGDPLALSILADLLTLVSD